MLYCTPIGGDCSLEERQHFIEYDKKFNIRKQLISYLEENLSDINFNFTLGGNIGVCVNPKGWDKSYCLQFIPKRFQLYFFYISRRNDYPYIQQS